MVSERMRMLDVFAGVGGFSLALKYACRTVAYYEIDDGCTTILKSNIDKKQLDDAPIVPDVSTITQHDIQKLNPFIVCAGFPCQDISVMTRGQHGVQGARSGIVFKLLQALKGTNVKLVFLENSSMIRIRGLEYFKQQLKLAGFPYLVEDLFSAKQCGAPHRRLRWFGVAYKDPSDFRKISCELKGSSFWNKEPCRRVLKRQPDKTRHDASMARFFVMGNAVVPECVKYAFTMLKADVLGYSRPASPKYELPIIQLDFPDRSKTVVGWATPTRSTTTQCRRYTRRCASRLTDQLFYEKTTFRGLQLPAVANQMFQVNPRWVCWLMGYPTDWTTAPCTSRGAPELPHFAFDGELASVHQGLEGLLRKDMLGVAATCAA